MFRCAAHSYLHFTFAQEMNESIPDHPIPKIDHPWLEEQKVSDALENESYRTEGITDEHLFRDRSALDGADREPVGRGNASLRAPTFARTL